MLENTNIGRVILEEISKNFPAEKTASENYDADMVDGLSSDLVKLSSSLDGVNPQRVSSIMKTASQCIRNLCSVVDNLKSKNEFLEKTAEVRTVLDDMVNLGLVDQSEVIEKTSELLKKDQREIEVVKEAMKLTKLGSGNIFFESDSGTSKPGGRRGMFDGVVE